MSVNQPSNFEILSAELNEIYEILEAHDSEGDAEVSMINLDARVGKLVVMVSEHVHLTGLNKYDVVIGDKYTTITYTIPHPQTDSDTTDVSVIHVPV